jgi:hypothetical protein
LPKYVRLDFNVLSTTAGLVAQMSLLKSLFASVALVAMTAPTLAQDSIEWTVPEVAGWLVAIDTTLGGVGGGCFIYTAFDGNAVVRLGVDPGQGQFYILVGDTDWNSIVADQSYDVTLQFGSRPVWTAASLGGRMGEVPTLMITSSEAAFVEEFAGQSNLRLVYSGQEIANLSLHGTRRAVNELLNCQEARDRPTGVAPNADPFASSAPSSDPFASAAPSTSSSSWESGKKVSR